MRFHPPNVIKFSSSVGTTQVHSIEVFCDGILPYVKVTRL